MSSASDVHVISCTDGEGVEALINALADTVKQRLVPKARWQLRSLSVSNIV